jgi:imidazolonepropionase-like amidohydrolase
MKRAIQTTALLASACLSSALWAQTIFIDDATVHTMMSPEPMESADILIEDGVISEVDYGLEIPADAQVIEAEGRPVTPGFFAGISSLGLEEVGAEASTVDNQLMLAAEATPDKIRPEFNVALAFNPLSPNIPVTRIEGYTWTLLGAQRAGTIIGGQGRPAMLSGTFDSMLGDPVLFVDIGADAVDQSGGSRAAQWMLLSQAIDESASAIEWMPATVLTPAGRKALSIYAGRGTTATTVFHADRAADIVQVLRFSEEHGLNPVITGGAEAWMVADRLARAEVPVLIDPLINLPYDFDQLGARLDNAALLNKAGVNIGFINAGDNTHNARVVRYRAGVAVAYGLPWQAALEALTINPARMFGIDHHTGTIEAHQKANIVIWSGDPLEATAVADQVIIDGKLDPMVSRQTMLRDRYFAPEGELPRDYIKP